MEIEDERAGLPHPAWLVDHCGLLCGCDTRRLHNHLDPLPNG
jgi:hypothetical protein